MKSKALFSFSRNFPLNRRKGSNIERHRITRLKNDSGGASAIEVLRCTQSYSKVTQFRSR